MRGAYSLVAPIGLAIALAGCANYFDPEAALEAERTRLTHLGFKVIAADTAEGVDLVMAYSGPPIETIRCRTPGGTRYEPLAPLLLGEGGAEQRFRHDSQLELTATSGEFFSSVAKGRISELFGSVAKEGIHVVSMSTHETADAPAARIEMINFEAEDDEAAFRSGLTCQPG